MTPASWGCPIAGQVVLLLVLAVLLARITSKTMTGGQRASGLGRSSPREGEPPVSDLLLWAVHMFH